jgi:hypothetical protein
MDETEKYEQENRILRALIGNDRRLWGLYDNSVEFHAGMRMLARTLPAFVKVMAQDAEEFTARYNTLIDELKRRPPTVPDVDTLKGWGYDYPDD